MFDRCLVVGVVGRAWIGLVEMCITRWVVLALRESGAVGLEILFVGVFSHWMGGLRFGDVFGFYWLCVILFVVICSVYWLWGFFLFLWVVLSV